MAKIYAQIQGPKPLNSISQAVHEIIKRSQGEASVETQAFEPTLKIGNTNERVVRVTVFRDKALPEGSIMEAIESVRKQRFPRTTIFISFRNSW